MSFDLREMIDQAIAQDGGEHSEEAVVDALRGVIANAMRLGMMEASEGADGVVVFKAAEPFAALPVTRACPQEER